MIYFDQAATSFQKPPEVADSMIHAMQTCSSVGRGGYQAASAASDIVYTARETAADMFDASPEQVVFTHNATHGLNIAIHSLVNKGDSVVISGFEHNAVIRPLSEIGASVTVLNEKLFDPDDAVSVLEKQLNHRTKAVVFTHVSNVFGYIHPIRRIAELCRENEIPLIVDASQSAGVLPVSLRDLNAAFIAMPGHKGLYGPQGTGILLCGMIPKALISGGTGSMSRNLKMPEFLPDIAEAGTHNVTGIAGLLAGLRYVNSRSLHSIRSHEGNLLRHLYEQIKRNDCITSYYGGDSVQTGVLSVAYSDIDSEYAAQLLSEAGFAVRAGLQCAPLAHRSAGTLEHGTVRISFSAFNTKNEVDALADVLNKIGST